MNQKIYKSKITFLIVIIFSIIILFLSNFTYYVNLNQDLLFAYETAFNEVIIGEDYTNDDVAIYFDDSNQNISNGLIVQEDSFMHFVYGYPEEIFYIDYQINEFADIFTNYIQLFYTSYLSQESITYIFISTCLNFLLFYAVFAIVGYCLNYFTIRNLTLKKVTVMCAIPVFINVVLYAYLRHIFNNEVLLFIILLLFSLTIFSIIYTKESKNKLI